MINKQKELTIGGISFGLTSGVITTLGLIVGLDSATSSKLAIVAGILTIAVADSLSDALGIHLSEESRMDESNKPIWTLSFFSFLGKFIFSILFIFPFLIFSNIDLAVIVSVFLAVAITIMLSIFVAKRKNDSVAKVVFEHTILMLLVIIASFYAGQLASNWTR